ncbi:DUF192 domain-containing protein [Halocalculus aciditolerans]|uniref:DUF192 domain-containing protein n=1 Tax=Halocalculus aciditolerans TaxID=1383812 RepID=A0A830FJV4_9EURY|nr:DUF192 domain-containing protein [Halocalculus aciditolerans]GGL63579.1 hypothetical protein GCM10009039_21870 [Halocalculus aciditolerans]
MRLVHDPADGDARVLAADVEVADSFFARARGLTFRRAIPDDYALAFPFGRVKRDALHMLFVPFAVDAVWTVDDEVRGKKRLPAWTGHTAFRADAVYELPAGAADDVDVGDTVRLEED